MFQQTFGVAFNDGPARGLGVVDTLSSIAGSVMDVVVALTNEIAIDAPDASPLRPPRWANFRPSVEDA
jgi:hypothetical protein